MERDFKGVWIAKEIYLHEGLNPTEKLLLAEIDSLSKNGECFASNDHFAKFLGISKNHVSKLISKLSKMSLISVDLIYKTGTKEVEKRVIIPIIIQAYTPNHLRVDPLSVDEDTPLIVNDYYKNTSFKNTIKNTININKKTNKKENSAEIEREFEQLWKIYPRKLGKANALKSYIKARKVKKTPYETIENGLYRYKDYLKAKETDEQYIMHGSTWFNQEKWLDEYIYHPTTTKKKQQSYLDYYKANFGVDGNAVSGNSQIIEYDSSLLS